MLPWLGVVKVCFSSRRRLVRLEEVLVRLVMFLDFVTGGMMGSMIVVTAVFRRVTMKVITDTAMAMVRRIGVTTDLVLITILGSGIEISIVMFMGLAALIITTATDISVGSMLLRTLLWTPLVRGRIHP
jgi:predicted ABC-type sugar transport system permease subunit